MNKKKQRSEYLKRQQELVDAAKAASRELTADEQAEFDKLQRQIEALTAEIEAEERSLQTPPPAPAGTGTTPTPAPATGTTPQVTNDEVKRAIEAERQRIADITSMCRDFDVDPKSYIAGPPWTTSGPLSWTSSAPPTAPSRPASTSPTAARMSSDGTPLTAFCFGAASSRRMLGTAQGGSPG